MKLKNKEIIDIINGLNALSEKELPIKTAYKILSNVESLMDKYNVYDKARRKTKNDQELIELLEIETEVKVEQIDREELENAEVKLTPMTLLSLKRIING